MMIAQSLSAERIRHLDALPFRENPRIHHPDLGWGVVDSIGNAQFRVRFQDHGIFVWFSLNNPVVAQWTVENAVAFARWALRAQN